MDASVLDAVFGALVIIADPERFGFLFLGVIFGLSIGILPGLGGVVGLTLLLPFTWDMDPYTALAFLMGLSSVVVTSDTITTVLLGVPGTVGSAATILDGFPMARNGEAGRAFGAAFSASMIGGVFGAFLLAISIPILRPAMLAIGTPDMLSFCIFGISVAAILSGGSVFKGLAGVCIGLIVAMTGDDPQTGTLRWTFDFLYLWDGIHIVPLTLGIFALPEIADLVIQRQSIQMDTSRTNPSGQRDGIRDTLRNWWLVLRCASIGTVLGSVPGVGTAVIDWVAYGHAARTEKGAADTFGKGDVRGVIASEAANNAKEGGALVPTIAFGIPGSASMVLILGAMLIHGLVPGPDMLGKNLDVTFTLVWSVAIANLLGAGICFAFAHQLAKLALVRIGILAPAVLVVVFIGAYQGSRQFGDLYVLLIFGVLGWFMKRMRWPRPPLVLGFVLGDTIETYMFISWQLYEWAWILRPVVLVMFAITLYGIIRPVIRRRLEAEGFAVRAEERDDEEKPGFQFDLIFNLAMLALFGYILWLSAEWDIGAKLGPQLAGWFGLCFVVALILRENLMPGDSGARQSGGFLGAGRSGFHFDAVTDFGGLTARDISSRGSAYFLWCLGLLAAIWIIGFLPAILLFLLVYLRFAAEESWAMTFGISLSIGTAAYLLFHKLLSMPWPESVIGNLFPALRTINSIALF
jgi:TctA family transporter